LSTTPSRTSTWSAPSASITPPAPALPPTAVTTSWRVQVMISRQTSSIALMFRQASAVGLALASMTPRWIPLQKVAPPCSRRTRVSWAAAERSAEASRWHWPVDAAPL
jgi:hypothetical protein